MGATLVAAAMQPEWASLCPRDRLALVTMSMHALDVGRSSTEAGLYFAGHDTIALALYGDVTEASLHAVKRAVGSLIKAGAVERLSDASGRYRRAVYRIRTLQPSLV